jgi:hypothetical protein
VKRFFVVAALLVGAIVGAIFGVGFFNDTPNNDVSGLPPLTLSPSPWKDQETDKYTWTNNGSGQSVGTIQYTFKKEIETWLLTSVEKINDQGVDHETTARVRIDPASLKPIGGEKFVKIQDPNGMTTSASFDTTYKDNKFTVNTNVNNAKGTSAIDVPSDVLDNDQILMTLRAQNYVDGYAARTAVATIGLNTDGVVLSSTDVGIRAQGQESLTIPTGTYKTWKLELSFGEKKSYAWYQVAAPYHLLKYDNGTATMTWTK